MTFSQDKFEIKHLEPNEVSKAAELEKETLFDEAWTEQGILETLKRNGKYFAVYKNGEFLGHGGFTYAADEGYITNIAVAKEARRQGVATAIIGEMLTSARNQGLKFLSLEVRESNLSAISLYQKSGFEIVGKRPNFYTNPKENAIIMTKEWKDL